MNTLIDKRTNIDPMRIAWLLRADLRRGEPVDGPISDWFKMWWLINGPREYPAWTDHSKLRKAELFRPLPQWPTHGGFGMSPALHFLLGIRQDIAAKFDVSTSEGLWDAIAWFFVHGLKDHRLESALDERTLAELDATPPFLMNKEDVKEETPEITWLMFFTWKTSDYLKTSYDIRSVSDRQKYVAWFLMNGVKQLGLIPLVTSRWKEWLRQPVLKNQTGASVPRAVHMLWQQHQQLQQAFDLRTEIGIRGLSLWSEEVWQTQAELSWIDHATDKTERKESILGERPFGLNLIGFAFGELGIGEDVRMAARACEAASIPFTVINIQPGETLRQADYALAAHISDSTDQNDLAPYAFNLFCLTGFDTARVYLERGNDLFKGRYNIGWWPWELPVWPSNWELAFDVVEEVWAATSFTYQMYNSAVSKLNSSSPTPVTLMPMPASVDRVIPLTRRKLELPADKFLFLYVFDFNSYLARKNPVAALEAFQMAFDRNDDSVRLVFKTMNANSENTDWQQFIKSCEKDARIIVMNKTMQRGEVLGLIRATDAYLSLHRSEGLGRTLAEAMLFGKPVIATDFSGNTDFVDSAHAYPVKWSPRSVNLGEYPYVTELDSAWWAEPSISHAAEQMSKARKSRTDSRIIRFAKSTFSPTRIGKMLLKRIQKLESER